MIRNDFVKLETSPRDQGKCKDHSVGAKETD